MYFGVRFLRISLIFVETINKKNKFMRKLLFTIAASLLLVTMYAQNMKAVKLNTPDKARGTSVMKALSDRHSDREFAVKELSLQDLSDLLWAANGINRPDGKRTAPSALNKQDIDVYVIMKEGAYLYDAKDNSLQPVAAGDHRAAVAGGQDFVKSAPVSIRPFPFRQRNTSGKTDGSSRCRHSLPEYQHLLCSHRVSNCPACLYGPSGIKTNPKIN